MRGSGRHRAGFRAPAVLLLALVTAVLLWAAFPPVALGWLAFLAPAPLLLGLRGAPGPATAAAAGLLFGLAFFGSLLSWMANAALIAWIALTIVLALYPAVYGVLLWIGRGLSPGRWWALAVGGWAAMEAVRARWPFGGFPWGSPGYAAGELPWVRAAAQWVGESGWSVLAVALAAGLVAASERRSRWLAAALAAVLLLAVGGAVAPPRAGGTELVVTVVQGSTPCPEQRCPSERQAIFDRHLELTRSLSPGDADLVVWPESSTGFEVDPVLEPETGRLIAEEARRLGAYLLVGGDRPVGEAYFLNVNLLFAPDGRIVGEYRKRHPVPFGEYVPFREALDFIPELERVPRDMLRGTEAVVFYLPQGALGSVISYEGAFARIVRDAVRAGAGLVVVATNESSFGYSPASDQFIGMTRMRAAENGVDVVHAAVSGRSTIVRADGTTGPRTPLFTSEVLSGTVAFRQAGPTLYTRWGEWVQLLAVGGALVAVATGIRRRRSAEPEPLREDQSTPSSSSR